MKIVDANVILRYLLNDVEEMSEKAIQSLEYQQIFIPNEVVAEVVYVLEKVYKLKRDVIAKTLSELLLYSNISFVDSKVVKEALDLYGSKKLDFVDTLLYGYSKIGNYSIITFDKQLDKLLNPV